MLSCALVSAQTSKMDSLMQVLASMEKDDYEKGELLLDIAIAYRNIDSMDMYKSYAMDALNLAKRQRLEEIESLAYFELASYYYRRQQHYISHGYYKKAEILAAKNNQKDLLCTIYCNLSIMFTLFNDIDNVNYYADKALEIASEWYDPVTLLPREDVSPETLEKINERWDMDVSVFFVQYAKGFERTKITSVHEMRSAAEEVVQEFLDFNIEMFQTALRLNTIHAQAQMFAMQSGNVLVLRDRPREAFYYLHWIVNDYNAEPYPFKQPVVSNSYAFLAEAHAILNQLDSAVYYLAKQNEIPYKSWQTEWYGLRARSLIEEKKGKHVAALESFKRYHNILDSIEKAMKTTDIARLRMWNELERKDAENQILQLEKVKQQMKIIAFAMAVVMLIALFTLLAIWYYKPASKRTKNTK